jgi:dTDP-4-dehydrorhamnose reductase
MKILLLGANGQLGKELERQLSSVANVAAFPRESLDITNHTAVRDAVRCVRPDIIVNAAAYTAVDKAETNADFVHAINADAVANLAQIAREQSLWLIHYSTDYVFDGSKQSPYFETDTPNPINVYGASKLAGEKAIAAANCQHLIFRTTWVIGKHGNNFAKTILRLASEHDALRVIGDQIGVPTSPSLITRVTIDAIRAIKESNAWPRGIYHLAPQGKTSWHEIAQTLIAYAERQHIPLRTHVADIQAITAAEHPTAAKRPLNSQLDTHKLRSQLSVDLPHWKDDFLAVACEIVEGLETV